MVSKWLKEVGVLLLIKCVGYDVYCLVDVVLVLVNLGVVVFGVEGVVDLCDLLLMECCVYYQLENECLKVELIIGQLVLVVEVEVDYVELVKKVVQFFDMLFDVFECKVGFMLEQVVKVQDECDCVW